MRLHIQGEIGTATQLYSCQSLGNINLPCTQGVSVYSTYVNSTERSAEVYLEQLRTYMHRTEYRCHLDVPPNFLIKNKITHTTTVCQKKKLLTMGACAKAGKRDV